MNAIPTKYAGVQFRSRLEARWAAFFDIVGWRWEYEPIDLAGYIPDFIIDNKTDRARGLRRLVEVKPVMELGGFDDAIAKIASSGWTDIASVVGAQLFDTSVGGVVLGLNGRAGRRWAPWWMVNADRTASDWREAANRVQWRKPVAPTESHPLPASCVPSPTQSTVQPGPRALIRLAIMRVLHAGPIKSKTRILSLTGGNRNAVLSEVDAMVDAGLLIVSELGFSVRPGKASSEVTAIIDARKAEQAENDRVRTLMRRDTVVETARDNGGVTVGFLVERFGMKSAAVLADLITPLVEAGVLVTAGKRGYQLADREPAR